MATETIKLKSSFLAEATYDSKRQVLEILFRNGSLYRYLHVTQNKFTRFKNAASKGSYFREYIKAQYKTKKL